MTIFDIGVTDGIAKTASTGIAALEVAGLGVLAKPALETLRHKNETAKARRHAKFELAGLGILAAHPAYELGKALVKRAAGGAASPGGTGMSPTTSGEMERETSSPGVSGKSWAQLDMQERVEPGPSPKRGRGVPEWVQYLKRMAMADATKDK